MLITLRFPNFALETVCCAHAVQKHPRCTSLETHTLWYLGHVVFWLQLFKIIILMFGGFVMASSSSFFHPYYHPLSLATFCNLRLDCDDGESIKQDMIWGPRIPNARLQMVPIYERQHTRSVVGKFQFRALFGMTTTTKGIGPPSATN